MSVIVAFPQSYFEDYKFSLVRMSKVLRSGYTGKRQVLSWPFALWACKCRFVPYTQFKDDEVGKIKSFLMKLRGQDNIFRLPVVDGIKPTSNYSGSEGVVNVANQTGNVITSSGWANNTLILKEGDCLTINDELKIATQDITTNGSGIATLVFEPIMKKSPPANASIKVRNCTVLMSSVTDDVASWDIQTAMKHSFSLDLIEAYE